MTYKPLKADSGGIGSKVTLRQASVHDTTSGATPIIDELNVWEFLIGSCQTVAVISCKKN